MARFCHTTPDYVESQMPARWFHRVVAFMNAKAKADSVRRVKGKDDEEDF